MSSYNAREIIRMGVEIEKNGEQFYREAAQKHSNSTIHDILLNLANWEVNHAQLFEKLAEKLPAEPERADHIFDTEDLSFKYVKAAADSHIFIKNSNMTTLVETCNTPADVLSMALTFEKDSVVLYQSMLDNMKHSDYEGKSYIKEIAQEELKHVAIIQESLEQYTT
ncbi:ferritin family protein [Chitinivibrio alkaliphilus]|uniref:Ferritin-like protein n=1 Tax=Chitinivibrio alkaliphilus ACht1 TaxID=1313304 RepID=U7D8N3_9BACT|nr:ferritin family protein [Chitinivibrio alkaliphilus]ERP31926.1 ferritin-like protein [Chitinivibrio alkaliphilus ACht1]